MKKILTITLTILVIIVVVCGTSYLTDKHQFNIWRVQSDKKIPWSKFYWTNDTLGGKYIEKTAMFIPCKIEGLPYTFTFQFDLGSDLTMIYERNINSVLLNHEGFKNPMQKLKSVLQFWDRHKSFKDLTVTMGDMIIQTSDCFVMENYGQELTINHADTITPISIGTIGADIFRDKVLIIDYPNQRFAICNSIPPVYNTKFIDIELDKSGKVILPMILNGNHYRISFDNGSSIFPIITLAKNINKFTTSKDIDTLEISSWGQLHNVTGKIISDTFKLAGHSFSNVKVYTNHSGLGIDRDTDGMTGNALFWDKRIIIDFKSKRFGVL